jgi:signal transduction histidine kinase
MPSRRGPSIVVPTRERDEVGDAPTSLVARAYVGAVTVVGLGLLGFLVTRLDFDAIAADTIGFWLFAALALIGELFPITLPRERDVEEIGTSTTFGFAVLLAFGTAAAAIVFASATIVADVLYGKRPFKVLFNLGQYTISVAAAGAVYQAIGGTPRVSLGSLIAIFASAAVLFLVNDVLTGVGLALARGQPIVPYLLSDFWFQAGTAMALMAMSPIVLIVRDRDPFLVPLLAVPIIAAHWGATTSLENSRLVDRLESALEQEKNLSRLKDDFVAVVSHELRTPLTSIQGYLKTLLQLGPDLGEEQRRSFLEAADRQGDRLRRLIEQLLAVAKLEARVEPLQLSLVSLAQVADHVVLELRPSAHGHTFDLRFPASLPLVETDDAKVHQILSNLVENALKYSPPDTRVTIRAEESDGGVAIMVEDEGRGIPVAAQGRIFERFFQVDSSATRSVGGTGLGLYICKKTGEAIGGRVWLERSTSEGTTFGLWLPSTLPSARAVVPVELTPQTASVPDHAAAQSMTASVSPA